MKVKVKSGIINFGVLNGYAAVYIGTNVKEVLSKEPDKGWKKFFKFLDEQELSTDFCSQHKIDGITYSTIFVQKKKDENWYATLAHEAFHMVQFLCDTHHIDMIQEKEMVAYLHTHILLQILKLNKQVFPQKKTKTTRLKNKKVIYYKK